MSISAWPEAERPREKLLARGAEALSDAELLAIFLRTGIKGLNAVEMARQLMQDFGDLSRLLNATAEEFQAKRGLGLAKYAQLMASKELSRRALLEEIRQTTVLDHPDKVRHYLRLVIGSRDIEVFMVIFLNAQHAVLAVEELFKGSVNETKVYPREVARRCLNHNAAAVIVAHNHPSGVCDPSAADHAITQVLKDTLHLIDVNLLDHFVVCAQQTESFAERGWL